jgi:hypothetical protein
MYKLLKATRRNETRIVDCIVQLDDEEPFDMISPLDIGLEEAAILDYVNDTVMSKEDADAEDARIIKEELAIQYKTLRLQEYRQLNQFEMLYDDKINGTTTWDDAIVAVKAKWPKDNSGPIE